MNEYRRERYLTVEEFAAFLGISLRTLSRIQSGEGAQVITIRKVAEKRVVHPSKIVELVPRREAEIR